MEEMAVTGIPDGIWEISDFRIADFRRIQELRILAFKRYQDHRRFLDLEREVVARRLGVTARS